jgi:hypothetical protein
VVEYGPGLGEKSRKKYGLGHVNGIKATSEAAET